MDHVLFQQCIVARVPPKQCVSENIFLRAIRKTFSFVQCARAGLIGSKKKKKKATKKKGGFDSFSSPKLDTDIIQM